MTFMGPRHFCLPGLLSLIKKKKKAIFYDCVGLMQSKVDSLLHIHYYYIDFFPF